MVSAKHVNGFFVLIVEEDGDNAFCKYLSDGQPKKEWFPVKDLIKQPPAKMVKIGLVSTKEKA